jgi:F-type H+-transporting ATPase subunit epsilon
MIVAMGTGALSVTSADGTDIYFVSRGYAEIDNDHIRILAETCEEKGEINVERAEAALQRAEERLKEVSGEIDWNRAEEAHKRAEHRIKIAKGE